MGGAGLFFLAIVMCVMCLSSMAVGGGKSEGHSFTVKQPQRVNLLIEQGESWGWSTVFILLMLLSSAYIAFKTRISGSELKLIWK
jgi:hypothetical protein